MAKLEDFYKNLDEEILNQQKSNKENSNQLAQTNNAENNVDMSELGAVDTAVDLGASAAVGAAEGLSYVVDLPFMLVDVLDNAGGFLFEKAAMAVGFSEDDIKNMESEYSQKITDEANKIRPGKYLRENFLTYDTKTDVGEYVRKAAEFAAPGGVFAKGAKAAKTFMATGAGSGVVAQGTENLTGSEGIGTGVGVGVNLGADLFALSRGNTSVLAKHIVPSNIDETAKVQKYAKDRGLTLKTSEASGEASVKKMDGTIESSIIGNGVVDKFWKNRPTEIKTFVNNWGKEMGIISKNKSLDNTQTYEQLKKAAVILNDQRTKLWKMSGGDKIKNFEYSSKEIANLKSEFTKLAETGSPELIKIVKDRIKRIEKSNGNGQVLQNIYMEFRQIKNQGNFQGGTVLDRKLYQDLTESIRNVLKSNSEWGKAQAKYAKFSKAYEEPITSGSLTKLFDDLGSAKFADKPETVGKMFKFLGSDEVSPTNIKKMARAVNKSGVPNAWQNIVSTYFNQRFTRAAADAANDGASAGVTFYKSIMKNEATKSNFTEMLYQLAKTKDRKVKYSDIENSVVQFANVLKATGKSGKAGSSTAANLLYKESAEKSLVKDATKFPFSFLTAAGEWMAKRNFTKTSDELAEAMVSENGIEELLNLAANWKDKNRVVAYLRAVTFGIEPTGELVDEVMN